MIKSVFPSLLIVFLILCSCKNEHPEPVAEPQIQYQNESHKLVHEMVEKVGTLEDLKQLHDVTYTYQYLRPDGREDISKEKYIFDGELSFAEYTKYKNSFPNMEGAIEMGYEGEEFWYKIDGVRKNDPDMMKRVVFKRKTNYYWFTMMQKLMDPGLEYKHVKTDTLDSNVYTVVDVTFDSDKPTDTYRLYINDSTKLVDQFLFTVADYDVMEVPFMMKMEYEDIEGIKIPTKRKYTKADWDGNVLNNDWIIVNWTDISFNNQLTVKDFQ